MRRALLEAFALALAALVALWAFVSHLGPAFSGVSAGEILLCN
ncbi:MAG TPA: hypothetical protein VLS93_18570 [Anaeromyxobacteraceae bacterium]|nr:hypothetical protein [Anaeromyxobacteraceae bacterium]